MPYDSNSQLPEAVQNSLSDSDQTKWRKIFNSALADTCDNDDTCAAKVAWSMTEKNARWYAGWASVEMVDKQGDLIEMEGFKKNIEAFFKMGAPIMDKHSNRKVGSYIDYEFKNKNGKPGLYVKGVIYRGLRIQDEVWEKISSKPPEYPAMSIGADPMENKKDCPKGSLTCFNRITDLETFEISPVDSPANTEATIEEVNHVAKSDITLITKGDSMTDETKEKEDVDGGEPVAGSTDKSEFDAEAVCKALTEQMTSMKAMFDKAFPPEEEEDEDEEEETEEKSADVAGEPSATLTIKEIRKAMREEMKAELKKLTATKEADTPRPDLKKHEMSAPFQKALENPDVLTKMSIKEIDAMMGEPKVGEKPW